MKRSITGLRVRFLSVTILIGHGRTGKSTGNTRADNGAVMLIQRFGSAANLNIHLHCLVLDGVYLKRDGAAVFHEAAEGQSARSTAPSRIADLRLRIANFRLTFNESSQIRFIIFPFN